MENFYKVVRIGKTFPKWHKTGYSVFCKIEYKDGRLSISGVEGPLQSGNARGSCGQINMSEWGITEYAPGWSEALEKQFREVWKRWHLNDIKAGSKVQEDYLRANPIPKEDYAYPKSHYDVASKKLAAAGLNPDPEGYEYGHSWKREEVPAEVLEFLQSLPETDVNPAWV